MNVLQCEGTPKRGLCAIVEAARQPLEFYMDAPACQLPTHDCWACVQGSALYFDRPLLCWKVCRQAECVRVQQIRGWNCVADAADAHGWQSCSCGPVTDTVKLACQMLTHDCLQANWAYALGVARVDSCLVDRPLLCCLLAMRLWRKVCACAADTRLHCVADAADAC